MNETDLATAAATEGIKQVGQVVPDVYKDAVQPAAQAGGHALGTLMNAFNMLLAPLERAQLRSEAKTERLRQELARGFEEIPEERRVEPPLEIVGPALESLKYVEDETLQDMFVQLLIASMDSERQSMAHRAFVKILEELSPSEARALSFISSNAFYLLRTDDKHLSVNESEVENLTRLSLVCTKEENYFDVTAGSYKIARIFALTHFGLDFCRTCIPNSST